MMRRPPSSPPFPDTPLFRPRGPVRRGGGLLRHDARRRPPRRIAGGLRLGIGVAQLLLLPARRPRARRSRRAGRRSEEHTSELQSRQYLVCRLLLEKKKKTIF